MRKPPLPGRHVTDCQMRMYMTLRQTHTAAISAAKSGFSAASAYRLEKDPRLPSGKTSPRDRRRPDPLAAVWESEIVPLLKAAPGLRPVAIFEEIGRRHPEMGDGVGQIDARHHPLMEQQQVGRYVLRMATRGEAHAFELVGTDGGKSLDALDDAHHSLR